MNCALTAFANMADCITSVAFPGLPVVFAEGYRVLDGRRISLHDSVGVALTDEKECVRTETTVRPSNLDTVLLVDGKPVQGARGKGMLKLVEELSAKAHSSPSLKIESKNCGILSGSSDSGAAALVVALNDFLELKLSREELLGVGVYGSETVFRSLYGGLTEYNVVGEVVSAKELADERELSSVTVFGVSFSGSRFSADEIHSAVLRHPNYEARGEQVKERITALKKCLSDGDLLGVFKIMEDDARTVHKMFADVGRRVIKPEMRFLCDAVEDWRRRGVEAFWNVAGGNQVYVFCLREQKKEVASLIKEGGWKAKVLKIAGESRTI